MTEKVTARILSSEKRCKGRPMRRWVDTFIEKAGKQWMMKAKEIEIWNAMREVYAEKATTIVITQ